MIIRYRIHGIQELNRRVSMPIELTTSKIFKALLYEIENDPIVYLFTNYCTQNYRKNCFQLPLRAKCGGGGAPLRSATGKMITKIHNDPSISFNDSGRKYIENHLRYKTNYEEKKQYKMDLDRCKNRQGIKNSLDMVCIMFDLFS